MQEFIVQITETLTKHVRVTAPNREAAVATVSRQWNDSQHVLDESNFEGVEFTVIAE